MCFICADLRDGILKEYDASLLAVELASVIGQSHAIEILEAIKRMRELEAKREAERKEDLFPFDMSNGFGFG
jgi:hypothetical protein